MTSPVTQAPDLTPLATALVTIWAAIRRRHPEVPPAIITIGPSVAAGRNAVTAGHWSPTRWSTPGADDPTARHHEVVITGEGLSDTTEGILDTLLHEAAHGLAYVRKIKDTSRDGRYHNKRFAKVADEMGLDTQELRNIGFARTSPRAATLEVFQVELDLLRAAHDALGKVFRVPSGGPRPTPPRPPQQPDDDNADDDGDDGDDGGAEPADENIAAGRKLALVCSCGFTLWIAAGVWRDRKPQIACLNDGCGLIFKPR